MPVAFREPTREEALNPVLYGRTVCGMNRDEDEFEDAQWIALCAERLRGQWPRADPTSLEEAARELWQRESFRMLAAEEAAERWLSCLRMPAQAPSA